MALINIDGENSWLREYEHTESLIRSITQCIVRRRRFEQGHTEYSQLSLQLRKEIRQGEEQISKLFSSLDGPDIYTSSSIALGENERRYRLCEVLSSKLAKALIEFQQGLPSEGPFTKDVSIAGFAQEMPESDYMSHLSNDSLLQKQKSLAVDQEASLDSLSKVVANQKRIAKAIGTEVDDQDDLLIDIRDHVDSTQSRIEGNTAELTNVTRKTTTCGYWIVIVLLGAAIIGISVW